MNLLIKNATVVLPDGETKLANIAVEETKILAIGDVPETFVAEQTIDAKDMLAIPGFVNAHTHASMTLLRSYADDMELMTWLNDHIWPVEAKMVSNDIYWGAALAAVEMIQSGTTTFADMYGPFMERVADVVAESGMRGVLSRGIIGVGRPHHGHVRPARAVYVPARLPQKSRGRSAEARRRGPHPHE